MHPLISVVIPTRNRPQLVVRAVQSALAQTLKNIEVIVAIDGSDEATDLELAKINDPHLRVIRLPENVGGSAARNAGVAKAQGEWIAFLDDDDEWRSQKLELQLKAAVNSSQESPIVTCRVIARTPKGDFIWPRKLLESSFPLSEYLFARNSLFRGEGKISTSTLLTKKELLEKAPFRTDLKRHQDWEWLLRVNTLEGVGIQFVSEPLVVWYTEEQRQSISSTNNWQYSLAWIQEHQHLVTPRAYAGFVLTEVAPQASRVGNWKSFWLLLRQAIRFGKPQPIDFLLYFGMWLIPQESRRWLRAVLTRRQTI